MHIKALFQSRGKMYSGNDNDILILCNQLSPIMVQFKGHTCSYWHSEYRENENADLILTYKRKIRNVHSALQEKNNLFGNVIYHKLHAKL